MMKTPDSFTGQETIKIHIYIKKGIKTMFRIYLTNLGKYNEGELIGEWVDLPATDDELEEVKTRIGISDEPDENGMYYEEYFITDYENDYGYKVDEYESLDDLNEIAEQLEDLDEEQKEAVAVYTEQYGGDINEAVKTVTNGDYSIYYNCGDMADVAYEVVQECGYLDQMPENLRNYFDYEAFGRDLDIEGNFFYSNGNYYEFY